MPLAHSEGGLAASMQRGIAAVLAGGSLQTFVLHDRMTRDSCFLFDSTEEAIICARWLADHTDELRAWLHDPANPLYQELGFPALEKGGHSKNLIGYFQGDTGTINQIVHLWKHDDDAGPVGPHTNQAAVTSST